MALGLFAQSVQAQQSTTPAPSAASAASPSAAATATTPPASRSRSLDDILKLADASVSKELMLTFVESSSGFYNLTASDIITLKEKKVADEVITALLKRDAEVKTSVAQVRGTTAAPAIVRRLSTEGTVDPESYDFWFYHYAYPRALSESYRMLAPYDPMLARRSKDYPGPVMGFNSGALTAGRNAPSQSRPSAGALGTNRR